MDRVELLRGIPIFEGLASEDLEALSRTLVERPFKAGEMIFHEGDPGTAMYIVAEGHVNIHLPGEASRRVSLKDLARGDFFGEIALFDDKPRSASALATTDARLLELRGDTLSSYLEGRPRAAMPILRMMVDRLRETNVLLSERAAKNSAREVEQAFGWGQRLADRVAELNGSWAFIIGLLLLTCLWTFVNTRLVLDKPFDEYPYVFFNLVLAILVALQGPLIVMSQNRQAMKDRAQSETDFQVNLKNELNIETILRELAEFRMEAARQLEALSQREAQPPPK
jgi:CRP/FNR family cyclic AMP-dependent transcriptional regulator